MKFLDDQLNELGEELKLTDKSKDQLKRKVLQNVHKNKKRNIKQFVWVAVTICMLFIVTSPFYSPTMASIAGRILPISIAPNYSDSEQNPHLTSQLLELVEKEGYAINFIGITPSPYTIEISLILKDSTLKQARDDLEPKITNYLYENGYDQYELKISEGTIPNQKTSLYQDSPYESVRRIVKDVFASYGYAEEANYELARLQHTWFSHILTLDMPDHIKESNEIVEDIEKEIEAQNLDVKEIEVYTFNLKHRQQDGRWGGISSNIYNAMAGKSTYQLSGLSYKVRKGHSYVSLKTNFEEPPSKEVIQEIETAIKDYLALPETQEEIKNDDYTIQFLLKNKKAFIKITN